MKRLLLLYLLLFTVSQVYSQGFDYTVREELGNDLIKVKSGNFYGVINQNDQVIVSVDYQDIIFREGKALLIKDNKITGILDSLGNVKNFSNTYTAHNKYKYVYDGMIPVEVSIASSNGTQIKYGFINTDGKPFKLTSKIKGFNRSSAKRLTLFDDILPFTDGIASVYSKYAGWKHIDISGKERYILDNKKIKTTFRSSVYHGHTIIISKDGIKEYQENSNHSALVKRVLSDREFIIDIVEKDGLVNYVSSEGVLVLDSLGRAVKYKNDSDSIIFIEQPKNDIIVIDSTALVDTLSLEKHIKIDVTPKTLQADSQGQAYTVVAIHNETNMAFDSISVSIVCNSTTKDRKGSLAARTTLSIPLYIPAKFSTSSISRTIILTLTYKEQTRELKIPVTIMRYNPSRSR